MSMIRDPEKEKEDIEYGLSSILAFGLAVILFILVNYIFIETTSDITNYMDDHRLGYKGMEFVALILFLFVFYILPGIIPLKRILPNEFNNYKLYRSMLGGIFGILYIAVMLFIIFPSYATMEGSERDGLLRTVFVWLTSIFVINILLAHQAFLNYVETKFTKSTYCQKKLECICEWFSVRLK